MNPYVYDFSDLLSEQEDTNDKLDSIYSRLGEIESIMVSGDSVDSNFYYEVGISLGLISFIMMVILLIYVCFSR